MSPISKTCSTNHVILWQDTQWSGLSVGKMKALSTLLFNTVSVHKRMDKISAEGTSSNNYNYNSFIKNVLTATLLYRQACAILEQSNDTKNKLQPECYAKQVFDPLKLFFWSFFIDCLPFSSCSTSVTSPLGIFPFSCSCGSAEVDRSPWRCVLTTMLRLGDDAYHHRKDRRQLHSWCTWTS